MNNKLATTNEVIMNNALIQEAQQLLSKMNEAEVRATFENAKTRLIYFRSLKNLNAKLAFAANDPVWWDGSKGYHEGTIVKVNRTTASVKETTGALWTVTLSLLQRLDQYAK